MLEGNQIEAVIGQPVHGTMGGELGKVGQIYLDDLTGKPEWATVKTGLFGTKESFVPLAEASFGESGLSVPYTKDQVNQAPQVDADQGHLTPQEEADLYRHYGLEYSDAGLPDGYVDQGQQEPTEGKGTTGYDTSGPTTDDAMTRSEEQLHVGTEKVAAGKARLRKYVVTEQQNVSVPVTREEVRVEREPITEANRAQSMDGPSISEEEHEVVLTEERVVVAKETVPVERVRLDVAEVTEEQQVSEEVRKEKIEAEGEIRKDR